MFRPEQESCPKGGHIFCFGRKHDARKVRAAERGAGRRSAPGPTLRAQRAGPTLRCTGPPIYPYLAASFFPAGSGFVAAFNNSAE